MGTMAGGSVRESVLRASFLLATAVLIALIVNWLSPRGLPLARYHILQPASARIKEIGLEKAKELFEQRTAVFVDSRDREEFVKGHIKGAFSLPTAEFDHHVPLFMELVTLTTPIVTYCSGQGCDSSTELAELLLGSGYTDVKVFYGGWQQWKDAGYPTEKSLD